MQGFKIKIITILFVCYFLTSIVGGGLLTQALFNTTDDGEKRCINMSDIAITITRIFLILYMITTGFMLILFFSKAK